MYCQYLVNGCARIVSWMPLEFSETDIVARRQFANRDVVLYSIGIEIHKSQIKIKNTVEFSVSRWNLCQHASIKKKGGGKEKETKRN